MRKEIEVKVKVNNFDEITFKLKELGCVLSDPITQHDTIFVDDNYGKFDEFQQGKNLLRIRKENDKFIFTIKNPQSNEQDSIEYETEISNSIEMKEAIFLMGYHETVQVHKTRIKTNYNNWEICLDKVDGLGSFVKVEEIVNTYDVDVEKIQNKLFDFLESLGVKKENRITQGYDTVIYSAKSSSL